MKKLLLLFILTIPRIAFANWTAQEIVLQTAVVSLFYLDGYQSYAMLQSGGFYELNPILGEKPPLWKLGVYYTACAFLHTGVSVFLKKKYPSVLPVWQSVFIGVEGHAIYKNFRLYASVKF